MFLCLVVLCVSTVRILFFSQTEVREKRTRSKEPITLLDLKALHFFWFERAITLNLIPQAKLVTKDN